MSLRTRILISIVLISALMLAYLYGYWMPTYLAAREQDHREEAQQHLASVAEGIVPLLLGRQLDALYETLDALRTRNREWVAIQLTDQQGRILYPLQMQPAPLTSEEDQPVLMQPVQILNTDLGMLTVKVDLRKKLGSIREKHLQLVMMTGLLFAAYIAILWLILERGVRRPLNALAHASKRLAEGDFETPLIRYGGREVSTLVDSFDGMRKSIRGYQAELENKNNSLTTLQHAVHQSPIAILISDMRRVIEYVNPRFLEMTGYASEDVVGMECMILGVGGLPPEQYQDLWNTINAGRPWQGEIRHRKKSGEVLLVAAFISPIIDEQGELIHYLVIMQDISRQRELEEQLRQAEKMETIGTLAGGIAHDFNNILAALLGYTELVKLRVGTSGKVPEYVNRITEGIYRARDLVRQILTFSRRNEQQRAPLQMSTVVNEAVKLLRATIPATIDIRQDIATDARVLADPTQIHQVIMNLCTNAFQAMEETGGILGISLHEQFISPDHAGDAELAPGRHVVLEVSDTGIGMSDEVKARIFDPYFTTKEKGKGTGLGLAVVYGIVRSHAGRITVFSKPGAGTTFIVTLPALPAAADACGADQQLLRKGGKERILFVDDEEQIRMMARELLTEFGYCVEVQSNGREALARLQRDLNSCDLMITDMAMPGMDGRELIEKARALRPDLPVILCTGFSPHISAKDAAEQGIGYLEKPIILNELLEEVRKRLRANPPPSNTA